jgi:hypothetical protein
MMRKAKALVGALSILGLVSAPAMAADKGGHQAQEKKQMEIAPSGWARSRSSSRIPSGGAS